MNEIPLDYEPCAECGYDHEYEPHEAQKTHQSLLMLEKDPVQSFCASCGADMGNSDICDCTSWDYENEFIH